MHASLNGGGFRRILTVTIGVPILLMVICAISLAIITDHLLHLMRLNRHVIDVISSCQECEKLIGDMETGERGFKMTGDARFLEPYSQAQTSLNGKLDDLDKLVANDPEKDDVKKLEQSVAQWRDQAAGWIQAGKYDSTDATLKETLAGKALMDSIRNQMNLLLQDEESQLALRRNQVDMTKQVVLYSEIATLAMVILLTAFHVWRQMQKLAASYEASLLETVNQKERFRVTLSSIGDAVIVTDLNGLITFMNLESERMTGWPWNEAKGKALHSVFRIINEETRQSVDDPVEKVFKEKRGVGLAHHTLLLSKSGAEWPIEDSAAPIYGPDKVMIGVVLVFHDATETRRAQRVLKTHAEELEQKVLTRTAELQRTINELEAFSYTVSHDLRAPLRAMQGYSNVLLEDYGSKWGPEERDLLARITKASERLDVLIQDVLTYSKVIKDHQAIEPVNLDFLVQDILTQYPTFQNARFHFDVQRPLETVLGHESGLTQVISNLLTNAVKFVSSDLEPQIKIWTEAREFTVRVWIEDNGIGIDPANHGRIFKMFEQVDGKKYDGTGMGLAIAKKAIENMQGSIGVESEVGQGTKMWIELLKAPNL